MAMIIIISLLIPILGFLLFLGLYIIKHNTKGILYSLVIALFFGFLAYHFNPPKIYDLYRHHQLVQQFMFDNSFFNLFEIIKNSDRELLIIVLSYLVSFTKNKDLLQFIVVFVGYFLLFYMMYDYRKRINISNIYFLIIVLNIITGFYILNFISGLFFYIGIILFSFGFYLDYAKNKRKLSWILYLISLLFHNSILFALLILLVYKFYKSQLNIKSLIVILLLIIFPNYILELLVNITNLKIFSDTLYMYNTYLLHNENMYMHYHGIMLLIEFLKLIMISIISIYYLLKKDEVKINGYLLLLLICTLFSITKSIVMIRFVMLAQFISIPLFLKFNNSNKKFKIFIMLLLIITTILYSCFFVKTIINQDFGSFFTDRIFQPFIKMFNK